MARIVVLTSAPDTEPVLPALDLLSHAVARVGTSPEQLLAAIDGDLTVVDGRIDLAGAKAQCRLLRTAGAEGVLLVVTEGGMSAISDSWEIDDVLLSTAGPAETDARIRLVLGRQVPAPTAARGQSGGITIDEQSYSAKLRGRPLNLTYKEFQLLNFLTAHPSRVFTREQLLSEVWGDDYFGGTRTVDVHVRRLRAKLGDAEQVIGTVRNVGYRFAPTEDGSDIG